jgi:hypothetical protein
MQTHFLGVVIEASDRGVFASQFPELEIGKIEEYHELFLRAWIALLVREPSYIAAQLNYPLAFHRFYSKAAFRPFAIEEYELFLQAILAIKPNSAELLEIAAVDPQGKTDMIRLYLANLTEIYTAEGRFADAIKMLHAAADRGILKPHLCEAFWRAGRQAEGLELLRRARETHLPREHYDFQFERAIQFLERANREYKARPRKRKNQVIPDLIRYT